MKSYRTGPNYVKSDICNFLLVITKSLETRKTARQSDSTDSSFMKWKQNDFSISNLVQSEMTTDKRLLTTFSY